MTATSSTPIDGPALLAALPARAVDSHKGSHGHVLVIGGSAGMRGAAVLAAQAALYGGAGRVSLLFADGGGPDLLPGLPELLRASPGQLDVLLPECVTVLGPGLSLDPSLAPLFDQVCRHARTLVLDADALTRLAAATPAAVPPGQARLLTPHPGEAARLLATDTATIQQAREASACALSSRYGATVVLKGAGSLVAGTGGELLLNTSGNPGLATAGMGDTLAGLLGALLAQGQPPLAAMALAVWLHGAAADLLASEGTGPRGMTASEVALAARRLLNGAARWPGRPLL